MSKVSMISGEVERPIKTRGEIESELAFSEKMYEMAKANGTLAQQEYLRGKIVMLKFVLNID